MSRSLSVEDECGYSVEAAARVFLEHGEYIRTVIRQKVRNKVEVEDFVQDFFLSLVSRPLPGDVRNIRSYLYRAIMNDIVDSRRRLRLYHAAIREHHTCSVSTNAQDDPGSVLADIEETVKFFGAIEERLNSSEAQAVILRYRDDCSTKEAARRMKVKPQTVSRYLSVGLNKLREFLSQVGEDNDDSSGS